MELEIAFRFSEANSLEEQAAFEELISGSVAAARPKLEEVIAAAEEIYVGSLPWVREQRSGQTIQEGKETESALEFDERLPNALEACADRMDQHQRQIVHQDQTRSISSLQKRIRAPAKALTASKNFLVP